MVKFWGIHNHSRESQQHVSNVWTKDKIEPLRNERKCESKWASVKKCVSLSQNRNKRNLPFASV